MADTTDPLSTGTVVVPPSTADYDPPTAVPAYRLERELGHGSFGSVWLATDTRLGHPVALKTVRTSGSPAQLRMLEEEAKRLVPLRHQNVIRATTWWTTGDTHYLVLEYLPNGSLADRLKAGPLPWADAARYLAGVADGLTYIHGKGLVHRDVKPSNVLLSGDDEAVLSDFGVSGRPTAGGAVMGSPPYMAPEVRAGVSGPPADLFAAAATFYHAVTGQLPFDDRRPATAGLPDPDPRLAGVPAGIEAVVRTGLAADPARRPTTVAFAGRLRAALNVVLTDTVAAAGGGRLGIEVLRVGADGVPRPVAAAAPPDRLTSRDLRRVPPAAPRAALRTNDRVLVRVRVDRPGYLTVLNVGPTGNLTLLFPDAPGPGGPVGVGAVDVLEAELCPPAGRERVLAVWTPDPRPIVPADWVGGPAGLVTRDLRRVRQAVADPTAGAVTAVIDLEHSTD